MNRKHSENTRHITIDIDPHSEKTVCPKCCSVIVARLSLWEAAERGIRIEKNEKDATFYCCGDCGTVWHEQ